eukprot:865376-Amorphochlora_amoeboformis.AAC.1
MRQRVHLRQGRHGSCSCFPLSLDLFTHVQRCSALLGFALLWFVSDLQAAHVQALSHWSMPPLRRRVL